ncbi:MAG: hypothetical protein NVS1B13_23530 [Flavisolibacter sp.]
MTNFNIELDFFPAPFHRRVLAWIIDQFVLLFYGLLAMKLLQSIRGFNTNFSEAFMVLLLLPFLIYYPLCEITMNGQSIGKKITAIKVVNEYGGQPGIGQFIIRWLIRTSDYIIVMVLLFAPSLTESGNVDFLLKIGVAGGLFLTDIILVNTSHKNQRLGDMLAHTLVIGLNKNLNINDTIFQDISDQYIPSFPQVMQLSDRDINSLKSILDTAKKRQDYGLAEKASEKIKNHLHIETNLSAFDFLEILLKDYNFLSVF